MNNDDTCYVVTNLNAPRGKIIKVDVNNPAKVSFHHNLYNVVFCSLPS